MGKLRVLGVIGRKYEALSPGARATLNAIGALILAPHLALVVFGLLARLLPSPLAIIPGIVILAYGVSYHFLPALIFGEPMYETKLFIVPSGGMGWLVTLALYTLASIGIGRIYARARR